MVHVELTPRPAAAGTVDTLLGMGIDRELAEQAVRPPFPHSRRTPSATPQTLPPHWNCCILEHNWLNTRPQFQEPWGPHLLTRARPLSGPTCRRRGRECGARVGTVRHLPCHIVT